MIDIFAPSPWQMTLGERAALEGVLSSLKPPLSIEIGTAEGGSLQRIATHSDHVHSFDLVEPSLPREQFPNVEFHTGDSHALLPQKLAELAAAGETVDFVLVDGDHSAEGVAKDLEDLLASPAIRRTIILIHDTLNDIVREGILRVDFAAHEKVAHVDLDVVGGHLSSGGPFRHQLWGGIGAVIVDDAAERYLTLEFHDPFEVFGAVRDALVADQEAGGSGDSIASATARPSAQAPPATGDAEVAELRRQRDELQARVARSHRTVEDLKGSASWRLTSPLRALKRRVEQSRTAH